jgi:VanZ family protein
MLPAWWIFMFCATHLPRLRLSADLPGGDKSAHFVAFGILALLLWFFAETMRRPTSNRFVWKAVILVAAYAAFDEVTQPIVGRGADVRDWLMDMLGAGAVLAILELRRRHRLKRPALDDSA